MRGGKTVILNYREIALSAIFTAVVFVYTAAIVVSTPATQGFFNIGEAGVYLAALIGGPIVGAIAGGVGSALADILLGYAHYAPGTLVIKGTEGYIAGYLFKKVRAVSRNKRVAFTLIIIVSFSAFMLISASSGIGIYIKTQIFGYNLVIKTVLPFLAIALVIIALDAFILMASAMESETPHAILSCVIAGLEMVMGYFLYEYFILGYGAYAFMEIPINIGQVIAGILIAIPTIKAMREMGYARTQ